MISLTPLRLCAIYTCLKDFPPFNRWGLPDADSVEFRTTLRKDRHGDFTADTKEAHRIMLSLPKHHHFDSAVKTMAHEMVHLSQEIAKTDSQTEHNADFMNRAKQVCKNFGFDEGQF
jgi:hypothetical protein